MHDCLGGCSTHKDFIVGKSHCAGGLKATRQANIKSKYGCPTIKEENTGNMSLGATSVIPGVWVAESARQVGEPYLLPCSHETTAFTGGAALVLP